MKVQYSEPIVKKRFLSTSFVDKNSNHSYQNTKDLGASKSAAKARAVRHANCNSHSLEYNKHMGDNILKFRVLNNLNSKQFAEQLGIGLQQLYKYENGSSKISGKVLSKVARILYSNVNSRTNSTLDKKIFLEMIIDYFNFKVSL